MRDPGHDHPTHADHAVPLRDETSRTRKRVICAVVATWLGLTVLAMWWLNPITIVDIAPICTASRTR